jgi:hypothetical protein
MTRHDTRHRQSLRRKFAFLTSVMRASPVLMRFLVLHPFMNVALSPHSSPAETNHLCSADCHGHLTVVLSRCTPIHWHHRTFFLADLDISPPAQPPLQPRTLLTQAQDITAIACICLLTYLIPLHATFSDNDLNCLMTVPSYDATTLIHASTLRALQLCFPLPSRQIHPLESSSTRGESS